MKKRWPGVEIWVTEYALAHQALSATQSFYNASAAWLDGADDVARYSYFGAFRSEDSNVGPDAVFLNNDGELTDLGAWYLGREATGVEPQSGGGGRGRRSVRMAGVVGGIVFVVAVLLM